LIKILVVDDSSLIRWALTQTLEREPDIQLVGTAPNGAVALRLIPIKNPDLVILDIEMPVMGGLETLRRIRETRPETKVIMFSAHTYAGASAAIEALSLGAEDFVAKPSQGTGAERLRSVQEELLSKVRALCVAPPVDSGGTPSFDSPAASRAAVAESPVPRTAGRSAIGIGVSTGGPNALATLLPTFPPELPSPVLVTQHMPPVFTAQLAQRLDSICSLSVREAEEGMLFEAGRVYIAPGDFHMEVRIEPRTSSPVVHLHRGPKENSCRPSVDVMLRSMEEVYGGRVVAAILTGMGRDGFEGVRALKARGASILAQSRESCVVYGMPSFVVEAGLADEVLPIEEIGPRLVRLASEFRRC